MKPNTKRNTLLFTPEEVLARYWGYTSFRPLQREIISSVLEGKDTLALLPTGGGKSICFQVPALCIEGVCLVVTPLVALMVDQVENLSKRGILAVEMHSGMHKREIEIGFEKCADGRAKFLYISPERLEQKNFKEMLRSMNISLIAVDEAHCISQWGYDFRPPYLRIAEIRQLLSEVPVIALTATAVPEVIIDIQKKLEFNISNVFSKSFARKNLAYVVSRVDDKIKKLLRICRGVSGCGIVYVRNRRQTIEICEILKSNGISASFYHAGLENKIRSQHQSEWMEGRVRIIVATNAFGMGIDKPDVRLVVHLDLPETLEAYFQEAGRAGRDEKKSYAVLLFNEHDIVASRNHLSLSWPELQTIKTVYSALGNFLQLPVGAGKDMSFDFNIGVFCKTYGLKPVTVYNTLKILERDGYLLLNDAWDSPSRVLFICSKEDLFAFQVKNVLADKIIRMIIRSYSGIFTDFTRINENEIAHRTGIDSPIVVEVLNKLHSMGYLEFIKSKSEPQLVFSTERLDSNELLLSKVYYAERKNQAFQKLSAVIKYAESDKECRSCNLVTYFGQENSEACGICDVCINKKRVKLTSKQNNDMVQQINFQLSNQKMKIHDLVICLNQYREDELLSIVRWLIEEEKIILDGEYLKNALSENQTE